MRQRVRAKKTTKIELVVDGGVLDNNDQGGEGWVSTLLERRERIFLKREKPTDTGLNYYFLLKIFLF